MRPRRASSWHEGLVRKKNCRNRRCAYRLLVPIASSVLCFHATSFAAQMSGLGAAVNDYYSPVKAAEYIELRLRPATDFYQKRVPTKTHLRTTFKLVLLTATVASSFLARHQLSQLVTIVTAFASMITAYSEFADADRKVER